MNEDQEKQQKAAASYRLMTGLILLVMGVLFIVFPLMLINAETNLDGSPAKNLSIGVLVATGVVMALFGLFFLLKKNKKEQ